MKSPLIPINILSIYKNALGDLIPVTEHMKSCTAETQNSINKADIGLEVCGKNKRKFIN